MFRINLLNLFLIKRPAYPDQTRYLIWARFSLFFILFLQIINNKKLDAQISDKLVIFFTDLPPLWVFLILHLHLHDTLHMSKFWILLKQKLLGKVSDQKLQLSPLSDGSCYISASLAFADILVGIVVVPFSLTQVFLILYKHLSVFVHIL